MHRTDAQLAEWKYIALQYRSRAKLEMNTNFIIYNFMRRYIL